MDGLIAWRHPKPRAVQGRCIGCTDVRVDRRKSKRLAHRIRAWARRRRMPRVVITSRLRRGSDVGRWLARWGWEHRIDARLSELDFGAWEGLRWSDIGAVAVDAWCADFAHHRPGGGETVAELLARCAAFITEVDDRGPVCVVGHAGWIGAAQWLAQRGGALPEATRWPRAIGYGATLQLSVSAAVDRVAPAYVPA
jgi:alpha-ribazole phosphatase